MNSPDHSFLRGKRLAALVRISDARGSDLASQKSTITGTARLADNSIRLWYEDVDRKRWQYHDSPAIESLLADAERGMYDVLVIDKQQRIGTFQERELFHFFTECERRGIVVYSVAEGNLSETNILTSLNAVIAAQSETKDQTNKAQNVARGMRENAMNFRYNGSTLPFGYDRICVAVDGTERFRLVEDRREANPDYVKGSKDSGHQRNINYFEVIYPNGHVERRVNPPGKGKQERYIYAVTVRSERVETVRLIFQMYADGFNRTEIAKRLNAARVDSGFKTYWQTTNITYILTNPIYGGSHSWRRTTAAIYSTILPDGRYEEVDAATQRKRRHGRSATAVAEDGQIKAGFDRDELRLIDEATLARVRARLAEELGEGEDRKTRRPRSDSFWLQPFLVCGDCGGSMRGHQAAGIEGSAHFLCGGFSKSKGLKVAAGACVACRISLRELDARLADFLAKYGSRVEYDLEAAYHRNTEHFNLPRAEAGVLLVRLRDEMEAYVLERLPVSEHATLDAPGGTSLVEAYRDLYAKDEGAAARAIEEIEAGIGRILEEAMTHKPGTIARRVLDGRIAGLEAEAERLQASMTPLHLRIDAVHRQLTDINAAIRAVASHSASRRSKQAGENLRKIVERIVIHSRHNPRGGGPNPTRLVDRVVFHPRAGEPIDFPGDPPVSGLADDTIERAKALIAGGASMCRAAKILNDEGRFSPRGKEWRSTILARQLPQAFLVQHGRVRGPQSRTPRNTPPAPGK